MQEEVSMPMSEPKLPHVEAPPVRMRTRRGELSRERVLAAALDLLERDGDGALSMRRLAAELGSAPMSLYRHVANKADLVDGVIALALSDLTTEGPEGGDLESRIIAWMHGLRAELNTHPAILPLLSSNHLLLPAFLGPVEILMQELQDSRLPRARTAKFAWEVLWFTMSFVVTEHHLRQSPAPVSAFTFANAASHADDLPLIAEALPDFDALSGDDIFESSARHLVAGLREELNAAVRAA